MSCGAITEGVLLDVPAKAEEGLANRRACHSRWRKAAANACVARKGRTVALMPCPQKERDAALATCASAKA
jgi:hypothetical protein